MGTGILKIGNKVEIRILQQVEQGWKTGERPPSYQTKVQDILENGDIEVAVPTEKGERVPLPSGVRLEFLFYTKSGMYRCVAQIKDRYIKDRLYVLLIEQKTPLEKFQRREYYRFECAMEVLYYPIMQKEVDITPLEELKEHHRLNYPEDLPKKAIAVDISGGGLRFVCEEPGQEGDYMVISIRLESESMNHLLEVVGKVLICQEIERPSGSRKGDQKKYEYRVQLFMAPKEREQIIKYIFEQERKSREKECKSR